MDHKVCPKNKVAHKNGINLYKVDMLNWVLDETKPSAHVQHPWKSIHPHNVFQNARETFDMSYLGLNKWNRTSNLEQDPVFPYRRDYSIHVNENNIKNDFGYKESLGWLTTYLPEVGFEYFINRGTVSAALRYTLEPM